MRQEGARRRDTTGSVNTGAAKKKFGKSSNPSRPSPVVWDATFPVVYWLVPENEAQRDNWPGDRGEHPAGKSIDHLPWLSNQTGVD